MYLRKIESFESGVVYFLLTNTDFTYFFLTFESVDLNNSAYFYPIPQILRAGH